MSCKISRRSFLKVSGCLMLGSAVSGLLCGAGDPAEGGAAHGRRPAGELRPCLCQGLRK